MSYLREVYLRVLRGAVVLCLGGILAIVFLNVVLRYVFNSGIFLTEGVAGLLFVWMTFAGALLVLYDGGHIGVDALVRRVPVTVQRGLFVIAHAVMLYVTYQMLIGSWHQMIINLKVISPGTRLPMALLYAAGVFFAALSGVFLLHQVCLLLTGRLPKSALVPGISEEESDAKRHVGTLSGEGRQ
ncbi:TRAP transporter small permease [Ponticoccus alexandrii]|uniref:TRAP transporter small permease protein n=1 Tax=Ponticoccus alexandrii TaxID=1943633 RepID=A0ABX7FF46_9RHOB|nr:TRAP transporter small permease [Ponticoccus alexandrii]ETA53160.1 C4-dicarboxylate ABC transporter permease [Rhodobacteraceae bacterium PD-2]QRF68770.1 TRAP transporter small permease subunit [Ponticoccus alexandrii]